MTFPFFLFPLFRLQHPLELKRRVSRDSLERSREGRDITKATSFSKLNDCHIRCMKHRSRVTHAHEVDPVLEGHPGFLMKES